MRFESAVIVAAYLWNLQASATRRIEHPRNVEELIENENNKRLYVLSTF